jgi:hypothetical protein
MRLGRAVEHPIILQAEEVLPAEAPLVPMDLRDIRRAKPEKLLFRLGARDAGDLVMKEFSFHFPGEALQEHPSQRFGGISFLHGYTLSGCCVVIQGGIAGTGPRDLVHDTSALQAEPDALAAALFVEMNRFHLAVIEPEEFLRAGSRRAAEQNALAVMLAHELVKDAA